MRNNKVHQIVITFNNSIEGGASGNEDEVKKISLDDGCDIPAIDRL